jgi:hypothetical protein
VPGHVTGGLNAFGTQVYIPIRHVPATRLIVFGSRVRHHALIKFADPRAARRLIIRHRALFNRERVRAQTADDTQSEITGALDNLSTFLQFVGLIALLLGGIGVASGVGAFVAGKIDTVATLRCLGAGRPLVFAVYLTQAAVLGLIAATAGAAGPAPGSPQRTDQARTRSLTPFSRSGPRSSMVSACPVRTSPRSVSLTRSSPGPAFAARRAAMLTALPTNCLS